MLYAVAQKLLQNGLMTGSPEKDEKLKNLQYAGLKPNSVNISGLNRLLNGEDPTYRDGDDQVNYMKMGLVGMALGVNANIYNSEGELEKKNKNKYNDFAKNMIASAVEVPSTALEQSFLKGTADLFTAIKDKKWDYWLTNWFKAVASIPLPNTLDAMNRATREYMPETKGDSLSERLSNVIKNKLWMTKDLPVLRDLWGEKVLQNPEGANGWLYQMFNVTKLEEIKVKPESKLIYELYTRTGSEDVVPSVPKENITINNEPIKLDTRQYEKYLEYVGQERLKLFRYYIKKDAFKSLKDEAKIKLLEKVWNSGRDIGKQKLIKEYGLGKQKPK
jgi:hypothetical protein